MATNIKTYAIRQKSTGLFIPRLETGRRRGGSRLEFSNEREPRLFHNKLAVKAFLGNWLQGIMENKYSNDPEWLEQYIKIIPQPHRNKDDIEIVEFELKEVK